MGAPGRQALQAEAHQALAPRIGDEPTPALAYARSQLLRFTHELAELVRFPSVSSQPGAAGDVRRCAAWLADHLKGIGLEQVQVVPTRLHPLVLGRWHRAPGRPTVLVYGHYDVQPADPIESWRSQPFEPVIRGTDLVARGASDDKGQFFAHLKAIDSYLRTGPLPVNVTVILEGEEEIGSPNLARFVHERRREIAADAAVVSDSEMLGRDRPALTYSFRGQLAFDLDVSGAAHDLHSGNFGGAVHNPLQALCEILAALHDPDGRIAIPGFYDSVRDVSADERRRMASTGPSDARVLADARSGRSGIGEAGYTLYERITIRPALTVNGLAGGYQGAGPKGVIPAKGSAKFSIRLVPDQDPSEIESLVHSHIERLTPPTVRSLLRTTLLAAPVVVNVEHPAVQAAVAAYARGFGVRPTLRRSGGTIPVVHLLQNLRIPTVAMGFGLPEDRAHGPNEKFGLPTFARAVATSIWFLALFGESRAGAVLAP